MENVTDRAMTWLFYTCLLGLVPVICRIAVWLVVNNSIEPFEAIDLVVFGLVLHSANINEVNRIADADREWKTLHNGTSTFFLMIYSLFLFGAISEGAEVNSKAILTISALMGVISIVLSVAVIKRADALAGAAA